MRLYLRERYSAGMIEMVKITFLFFFFIYLYEKVL